MTRTASKDRAGPRAPAPPRYRANRVQANTEAASRRTHAGDQWLASGLAEVGVSVAAAQEMASLGHVAVGLAAGRLAAPRDTRVTPWMALFAVLGLLPNIDLLGTFLGHPFPWPFGHRGATHSLMFAAATALAVALATHRRGRFAMVFLAALAVAVSHPCLDMLTHGGRGIMLLWPASTERFRWPWTPLPAVPVGLRLLFSRGLSTMALEAVVFSPLLVVALWPRGVRNRAPAPVLVQPQSSESPR